MRRTSIQNMLFRFPRWLIFKKGEPLGQVLNLSISLSVFQNLSCTKHSFIVDNNCFRSWFFAFSWSDSLFDSFSFWRCREWRLNTNWIRFRRNWLQTIFWNIRFINVPLGGVIERRRVNWSQIRINKWLHTICVTRESNFFLLAIVRNLKWTGDNFSTILYGPNQLCINFLNNPFLVRGV